MKAFLPGIAVATLALVGLFAGPAHAAEAAPASGAYQGVTTYESWESQNGDPQPAPTREALDLTCTGATCRIPNDGVPFDVTSVAPGHYRGRVDDPDPADPGCTWGAAGAPHRDYDVTFSGANVTIRVVRPLAKYEWNCGGSIGPVGIQSYVEVFQGRLAADPAAPRPATRRVADASATVSTDQLASRVAVATGRRSSVPASLATPAEAFANPGRAAQNALLAAVLVLLMVFPSELFNSTFDKHHDRITAAWRSRLGVATRKRPPPTPERRATTYVSVAIAGSLLAGFLDPHFTFNTASVALFVGVFATTLFGTAVSGLTGRTYRRARQYPITATLKAVPAGLVVALVCVVVSRSVHFAPGYLYGLVGGFSFATALDRREEGQAQFLGLLTGLGIAVVGWLLFVPINHAANHPHPNFLLLVADSFVAALFIGGIVGALFSSVPLRFLPGHHVARWSWTSWSIAIGITAFLFVQVLLRPQAGYLGHSTTASTLVTYGLFGLFGIASIVFWNYFRTHPDPPRAAELPPPSGVHPERAPTSAH